MHSETIGERKEIMGPFTGIMAIHRTMPTTDPTTTKGIGTIRNGNTGKGDTGTGKEESMKDIVAGM